MNENMSKIALHINITLKWYLILNFSTSNIAFDLLLQLIHNQCIKARVLSFIKHTTYV